MCATLTGMSNSDIPVDWRPVGWSLAWSWLLAFIPTAVIAIRVANSRFALTDDAVIVRTGLVTKKTEHVELYRVRDVAASENVFSGGRLALTLQDGTAQVVQPIKDADSVARQVRALVSSARDARNVQTRENL